MLPLLELRNLLCVALRACFGRWNLGLVSVVRIRVSVAMAGVAAHTRFAVMALFPVGNDVGSLF
jgi:hypothetical protein